MRKSGSTRVKACQTISDILKPCDILGGQTVIQRIPIIQTATDQCICHQNGNEFMKSNIVGEIIEVVQS